MSDIPAPMLSGKRVQERVEHLTAYYYDRLLTYLKAFMQDGFPPGTVPPANWREELAGLTPVAQMVAQKIMAGEPATVREQQALRRWFQLTGREDAEQTQA